MDRRVTLLGVPYLHVNRPLLCFCVSYAFLASRRDVFVPLDSPRVYWPYYKNGVDCCGTAPLGLDIREVAYKNTALYSRTFHGCGTCDGLVLWIAGHTPESIVFIYIVIHVPFFIHCHLPISLVIYALLLII